MRARLLATSLLLLLPAFSVTAAEEKADEKTAPDLAKMFAQRDANGDGSLSLDEFKAGLKDKALENADKKFKKLDTDGDGKLSLDEFKTRKPAKNK